MKKLPVSLVITLVAVLTACSHKMHQASSHSFSDLPVFNKEGHRGTRGLMPENTLPSFYKAIDLGVNTIETDLVISKDRQVVLSHDIYFHSDITTTPEGNTLDPKEPQRLLYTMNYDSIRKYDVGLKAHKEFPLQQRLAAYKPTFSEFIDSIQAYTAARNKKVVYNIELKTNPSFDGTKQPAVAETVDLIMKVIRSKKIEGYYYLQSFDFRPLQILHKKYPAVTTAILIGGNEKRTLDQQLEDLGYIPEMYSPHFSLITPQLVEACHKKNIKVIPWTVNTAEDIKRMKDMGVDGIITDYPNLL